MPPNAPNPYLSFLNQAQIELDTANEAIEAVAFPKDSSPLDDLHHMKLLLQYQLYSQDAINQLLKLNRRVCEALGISSFNPDALNLEHLAYIAGTEALPFLLKHIDQLIDILTRLLEKAQLRHTLAKQPAEKAALCPEESEEVTHKKIDRKLQLALRAQKKHINLIAHLIKDLERVPGQVRPGPVYNHIAAIEGPISRFHQCLQHGLTLSSELYKKIYSPKTLEIALNQKPTQTLVKQAPPALNLKEKNLEERAAAKRLGHFFRL